MAAGNPYSISAEVYDVIYQWLDYDGEAAKVTGYIRERSPAAGTLLEVACGTGEYLVRFRDEFDVAGIDISEAMLQVARSKLPGVRLGVADMLTLDLGARFDAVVCLFSSIGYMKTVAQLNAAIGRMAAHTNPGGVVVVDPWFDTASWIPGHVSLQSDSREATTVARMAFSTVDGDMSISEMHHLVGREGGGVDYYVERHEMGLFDPEVYESAFEEAGLDVVSYPEDFGGRGRFVGTRG